MTSFKTGNIVLSLVEQQYAGISTVPDYVELKWNNSWIQKND